VTERI